MGDAPTIFRLKPAVADAIAAGEVVERPASVIKELLENAVDAGAGRITVEITDGGLTSMIVSDNGSGMDPRDLPLAVERHATSKLTAIDDLMSLRTNGFRGEALASIAAIADVVITSRQAGANEAAELHVRGGEIIAQRRVGGAVGTTVTVHDLFSTTPARLKFLKGERSEQIAITRLVGELVLAMPAPQLTLVADGKLLLSSPGGSLEDAIPAVFGRREAQQLLPVSYIEHGMSVGGYISEPTVHKGIRGGMVCIVNHRRIHHPSMVRAIEEAYRGFLPNKRYPFGVVTLKISPELVDVNVHPSKREVRFVNEREMFSTVQRACWEAVQRGSVVVAGAGVREHADAMSSIHTMDSVDTMVQQGAERSQSMTPVSVLADAIARAPAGTGGAGDRDPQREQLQLFPTSGGEARTTQAVEVPSTLAAIAPLRALGQIGTTWLLAESPIGAVVVDPHAAHEKILYEEIRARLREQRAPDLQRLLIPLTIECTMQQRQAIEDAREELVTFGVAIEPFGPTTLRCTAVPATGRSHNLEQFVAALLDLLERPGGSRADREHACAALVACHSAVRLGDHLDLTEQQRLLDRLVVQPSALTCPHGRPTTIILDDGYLRAQFRRPSAPRLNR